MTHCNLEEPLDEHTNHFIIFETKIRSQNTPKKTYLNKISSYITPSWRENVRSQRNKEDRVSPRQAKGEKDCPISWSPRQSEISFMTQSHMTDPSLGFRRNR